MHSNRSQIFVLANKLSKCIPTSISNSFLKKQEQSFYYFYQNEKIRTKKDKKIANLKIKQELNSINKINKIKYY